MNDGKGIDPENLYTRQPSSPYAHLNVTTRTRHSEAGVHSPTLYEELNNDVWNEIFALSKEHVKPSRVNQFNANDEIINEASEEIFPICGKLIAGETNNNIVPPVVLLNHDFLNTKRKKANHKPHGKHWNISESVTSSYCGDNDEVNSVFIEANQVTVSAPSLRDEVHDSIQDIDFLPTSDQQALLDGQHFRTNCNINRPLPAIPSTCENVDILNNHTISSRKIISWRMCAVIAGIFLLLCAISTIVVMTVFFTTGALSHRNNGTIGIQNHANKQSTLLNSTHRETTERLNDTVHDTNSTARWLVRKPKLLHVLPGNVGSIHSITMLNDELFVIRGESSAHIDVYSTRNFKFTRNITINGSSFLSAIVANPQNNCLYISDLVLNVIYRYNLSNNDIINWSIGEPCFGLSLTSRNTLLATLYITKQIRESTADGDLIRTIQLDQSIAKPEYSIQLSTDRLAVSHGADSKHAKLHRVCTFYMHRSSIECYGGSPGADLGRLNEPRHLAVDRYGTILVADQINDRIVLLNSSLSYLGDLTIPGEHMRAPHALHLDELNHRLYIGEETKIGRIFVLSV